MAESKLTREEALEAVKEFKENGGVAMMSEDPSDEELFYFADMAIQYKNLLASFGRR